MWVYSRPNQSSNSWLIPSNFILLSLLFIRNEGICNSRTYRNFSWSREAYFQLSKYLLCVRLLPKSHYIFAKINIYFYLKIMYDVIQICYFKSVLEVLHYTVNTRINIRNKSEQIIHIDGNEDSVVIWDKWSVICFSLYKVKLSKKAQESLLPDQCCLLQAV